MKNTVITSEDEDCNFANRVPFDMQFENPIGFSLKKQHS